MAEQFKLGYRPHLDGMRAFAVLAVMGIHAGDGIPGFASGHLGVDVFFTLSGFLITSLLLEELREYDRVWLAGFWARRALRLVPALVALLAFVWLTAEWLWPNSRAGILPSLLYYMNWHMIFGPGSSGAGMLTYTWSLAIEEQFYLLWPLALVWLWRRDRTLGMAIRLCTFAAVTSAVARVIVAQNAAPGRWYRDFFLRADALLAGCILSLVIYSLGRLPRPLAGRWVGAGGLVVLAALGVMNEVGGLTRTVMATQHVVVSVGTVALISSVVNGTAPRVLSHPIAVWIGTRSYGLYLWHGPFFRNRIIDMDSAGGVAVAFALTFVAVELSYRLIELPFLRLKPLVRQRGELRAVAALTTR